MAKKPSGNGAEKVIGNDDRIDITNTAHPPYSAICIIGTTWQDGTNELGSAFVWGKQTVFTAGHLLYNAAKGWAVSVRVVAGMIGKTKPFGNVDAGRALLRVHTKYVKGDPTYDLGAIFLPQPLGQRTGWSDLGFIDPKVGEELVVTGYPGELIVSQGQAHLQQARGRITGEEFGLATYDADATAGESGAPIWRGSDVPPYVMICGLHKGQLDPVPANAALLFTREHCDWILARVAEAECWPGSPPWRPNGEAMTEEAASALQRVRPRQWPGSGPIASSPAEPGMFAGKVPDVDYAVLQADAAGKESQLPAGSSAEASESAHEENFTVEAKGSHAVQVNMAAGQTLSGSVRIALPSGTFTDIALALKTGPRSEVDHASWCISSSGAKDFHSERFSFAAVRSGPHSLELRELNGVSAAIVQMKFKIG